MALGLLMCGRDELLFSKLAVDLSFEGAFRVWPYAGRFRQIASDLKNGSDGMWVMLHADKHKRVLNLYWETDMQAIQICARGYWQDNELDPCQAAESIDGDVPAEGWKALAEAFLSRLRRD